MPNCSPLSNRPLAGGVSRFPQDECREKAIFPSDFSIRGGKNNEATRGRRRQIPTASEWKVSSSEAVAAVGGGGEKVAGNHKQQRVPTNLSAEPLGKKKSKSRGHRRQQEDRAPLQINRRTEENGMIRFLGSESAQT